MAPDDRGEALDLGTQGRSRHGAGLFEPHNPGLVGHELPRAAHDTARDDDRCDPATLFADGRAPRRSEDLTVVGARTKHVLIEARQ